jgi:hypothetical protein
MVIIICKNDLLAKSFVIWDVTLPDTVLNEDRNSLACSLTEDTNRDLILRIRVSTTLSSMLSLIGSVL